MKRIVITGYGAIAATGHDLDTIWQSILDKKSGITKNTGAHPYAAEIKNCDLKNLVSDKKLLKLISKHDVFGLYAARCAVAHAQITPSPADSETTGIYVGSPGNKYYQQYDFMPLLAKSQGDMQIFAKELFTTVHPMWLLKILPNNVLAYAAIEHQFKGPNETITNHALGGLQAIIEATHALRQGQINRALVIAYDMGPAAQEQMYYGESQILSRDGTTGVVLGEGAGAIFLETEASAKARGAKIYGEVLTGAVATEARGIFSIDPEASGLILAIEKTLKQAKLAPSDVSLITAHANGNPQSDNSEQVAFAHIFSAMPKLAQFKWSIGHTLAAAGVIETLLTLKSLKPGQTGLIINRAFGSQNAGLLICAA